MRTYKRDINENHLVLNTRPILKVSVKDVVLLKSEVNYTIFHFKFGRTRMVAHTLKFFESFLEEQGFLRVHRSCIINPMFIKEYDKVSQILLMTNGEVVNIARRRQKDFKQFSV